MALPTQQTAPQPQLVFADVDEFIVYLEGQISTKRIEALSNWRRAQATIAAMVKQRDDAIASKTAQPDIDAPPTE